MRKMVKRTPRKNSGRINSMLNDDLLGLILEKIKDREHRESFSEVCKQWLRVERLTRTSLTVYRPISRRVIRLMSGFPCVVDLRTYELTTRRKRRMKRAWQYPQTDTKLEDIAKTFHKLETFRVRCMEYSHDDAHLGPKGLHALGTGCPELSTVIFWGYKVVGNLGVDALIQAAHNLRSLYLSDNVLISDPALRAIGSSSISTLELLYCDNVTDVGLGFLTNGSTSKTLKRLVLKGFFKITDTGVELLRNMCKLEHLALSSRDEIRRITDIGGVAVSAIQTLKELILSNMDVSDHTVAALAENCSKLETLDLQHCIRVTGAGIRAFSGHKCLKLFELIGLTNLDHSDVERIALGCSSLKSIVVDKLLTRSFELICENARRLITFRSDPKFPDFRAALR